MSSKRYKGKAPAAYIQDDAITVLESQTPPAQHSTQPKGKNAVEDSQARSSSAAQTMIPSGSRAVDDDTPASQQLRNEGIQRPSYQTNSPSPEEWEAVQKEIAALRSANQELLRQSKAPEPGDSRKHQQSRNTPNQGQKPSSDQDQQNQDTPRNDPVNSPLGIPIGNPQFRQRPFGGRSASPSSSDDDSSSPSDSSKGSDPRPKRHKPRRRRKRRSHSRRSHKLDDPDKLNNGENPTYKQWRDLLDGKMYGNRDWWKTEQD